MNDDLDLPHLVRTELTLELCDPSDGDWLVLDDGTLDIGVWREDRRRWPRFRYAFSRLLNRAR